MKTSVFYQAILLICIGFFAMGCKDAECSRMLECCAEVQDLDGLGQACGPLAEQTTNPDSCRSVTETVRYMLKDREKPIPASCQ